MLKAIIFDYNGILVDDLVYHRDAYLRVAEELGFSLAPDAIWQYISATPDEKRVLFGEITDETWRKIRSLKDTRYFEMIESENLIIPGVEDVVRRLHSNYVLGLISNTSRRYYERIFPRHIAECFRETLFSEEMNAPKPAPDPLLKMMKMLAVYPDECCYVGDAVSDAQMTRSAGVRMIGVTTGHHSREALINAGADRVVDNLKEFLELIPKSLIQENRKTPIDG